MNSPDLESFRTLVREWLTANAEPRDPSRDMDLQLEHRIADLTDEARAWQREKFEAGFAGLSWPERYGGRGMDLFAEVIWQQEVLNFDVPERPFTVAMQMCGPAIMELGDDLQRERFLPAILSGDHIWCQMFSEPGAGSDLASLSTRARRVDGGWLLTGQKVWTSFAHFADWGTVLARSDMTLPKRESISYFLLDMTTDGIDVRPLRQMTGGSTYNEVFLDDAFVPDDCVLGEVGGGWRGAIVTLMNERVGNTTRGMKRVTEVGQLVDLIQSTVPATDPAYEHHMLIAGELYERATVLSRLGERVTAAIQRRQSTGPEGAIGKLLSARLGTDLAEAAMNVLGSTALASDETDPLRTMWLHRFLDAPARHIAGGTDEILLNTLAERSLGLPREERR